MWWVLGVRQDHTLGWVTGSGLVIIGVVVAALGCHRAHRFRSKHLQVTEQLEIQQRVNQLAIQERDRLLALLARLPVGVLLIDKDDRVQYFNQAAHDWLGTIPDRLRGLAPVELYQLVTESRDEQKVLSNSIEWGFHGRLMGVVAVSHTDGQVLVLLDDVTAAIRSSQTHRDFVADASHELRTPLATISASLDAAQLALENDPERVTEFMQQIEQGVWHLGQLTENLLDLSRLDSRSQLTDQFQLDEVVTREIALVSTSAERRGITLHFDLVPLKMTGTKTGLALAVRNLLENAVRYNLEKGEVWVQLTGNERTACLAIRDTGPGIPIRAQGRIFERFYRVDPARSRSLGGNGLGLAIVKGVMDLCGGQVSVESELGQGSTFTLTFPRTPEN